MGRERVEKGKDGGEKVEETKGGRKEIVGKGKVGSDCAVLKIPLSKALVLDPR